MLNLSDILPLRWYVAGCAALAAAANAGAPPGAFVRARRLPAARSPGMALAGVYPPAMKMAATWFRAERGLAIGAVVGALTVGKAMPYLLEGGGHLPRRVRSSRCRRSRRSSPALLIAAWYRDGPSRLSGATVFLGPGGCQSPASRCCVGSPAATWGTCGSFTRSGRGSRRFSPRRLRPTPRVAALPASRRILAVRLRRDRRGRLSLGRPRRRPDRPGAGGARRAGRERSVLRPERAGVRRPATGWSSPSASSGASP